MDLSTLQQFRHEISTCFTRAKDALFNTVDALITETQARSFPELSLSPFFARQWHSLYEAFEDGKIDPKRLQKVFLKYLPAPSAGKRLILGVDATQIERPFSITSPQRTAMPIHNIPHTIPKKSTAITFGWKYSTVMALPEKPSSWTFIMDQQRIPSDKTDIEVAITQVKEIIPQLAQRPLVLLDRGSVSVFLWCQLSGLPVDVLGRLKCNQTFYKPAPSHTGKKGQPRKDGTKLKLDDPCTHKSPDEIWKGADARGHSVQIHWWKKMHVKDARWLD
ncbi:MAG: transposase, partial [Chloroflexi bacterium]